MPRHHGHEVTTADSYLCSHRWSSRTPPSVAIEDWDPLAKFQDGRFVPSHCLFLVAALWVSAASSFSGV
jgi:hypothetical protein